MLSSVGQSLEQAPEHRAAGDIQHGLVDARLGALFAFYGLLASFRAYQRHAQERHGRNNAKGLFGLEVSPSDGQLLFPMDQV